MSAAPFGGHPTLREYLTWAKRHAKCRWDQQIVVDDDGRPFTVYVILAPDGRFVTSVGIELDEYLTPTTVARFDRRLGIKSSFPSLPENGALDC